MDLEDFIVSNNLLPLGSVVYLLFCVTRYGWGWDNFIKETNTGKGLKFGLQSDPVLSYLYSAADHTGNLYPRVSGDDLWIKVRAAKKNVDFEKSTCLIQICLLY